MRLRHSVDSSAVYNSIMVLLKSSGKLLPGVCHAMLRNLALANVQLLSVYPRANFVICS